MPRSYTPLALMVDAIHQLKAHIEDLAASGQTMAWGSISLLGTSAGVATGAAFGTYGNLRGTTDGVLLTKVRCGDELGLVAVAITGNYKDEGTIVATAAVVAAFERVLAEPLPAECDVGPALRRAMIGAQDDIFELSREVVAPEAFGTCVGPRKSLKGIGASVAAVLVSSHAAWITSIGECSAWLARDRSAKRLNVPDTLAHTPDYRERIARDPANVISGADDIVLRALGMRAEAPSLVVTRLVVQPGDRLVVGTERVASRIVTLPDPSQCAADEICRALVATAEVDPRAPPGVVAVIAL